MVFMIKNIVRTCVEVYITQNQACKKFDQLKYTVNKKIVSSVGAQLTPSNFQKS